MQDTVPQTKILASDSQAALNTLTSYQITLKLAWGSLENLRTLAKHTVMYFGVGVEV